jgi:hypothetical protein
MNGQKGASSCATVTRQHCNVANAAGEPSQNSRRMRRTYQFDRSSTNAWIARPAPVASKLSIRSRTTVTVACSRDRTQRSSSDSVSAWTSRGTSFAFAYRT